MKLQYNSRESITAETPAILLRSVAISKPVRFSICASIATEFLAIVLPPAIMSEAAILLSRPIANKSIRTRPTVRDPCLHFKAYRPRESIVYEFTVILLRYDKIPASVIWHIARKRPLQNEFGTVLLQHDKLPVVLVWWLLIQKTN